MTVTDIDPRVRVSAALSVSGASPRLGLEWQTRTPYTHHLQDWPAWLETGEGGTQVTVRELPLREQIDVPVREQLIVELYSK